MTETLTAIALYLLAVLADGDWANDWLTHVPTIVQPTLLLLGQALAAVTGA